MGKNVLLVTDYHTPKEGIWKAKTKLATSQTELCERLNGDGYKVFVVARKVRGSKDREKINGVEIYRTLFIDIAVLRFFSWFITSMIKILLLSQIEHFDVIICWDTPTVFPPLLASKIYGIPIICSIRGPSLSYQSKSKMKSLILDLFEKVAFSNSSILTFSSKWAKDTMNFKYNRRNIILHHGVNIKRFNPKIKPIIREKIPIIGFFGRLGKEKGVDTLLKAAVKLKKRGLKFKIIMTGEGEESKKLKNFSDKFDLGVNFLGFVDGKDLPGYMASADIVVLPSHREGFANALIESMALGKAVVVSAIGGAPELIQDWKDGVKFKAGNVDSLTTILSKLLKSEKIRKEIGKNAGLFIEKNYSWDRMINKWEAVINKV